MTKQFSGNNPILHINLLVANLPEATGNEKQSKCKMDSPTLKNLYKV